VNKRLFIVAVVLALLASLLMLPSALADTTIFSDDFEDGDYSGWSNSGTVNMETLNARGSYSVELKGDGQIWRTVSTSGYTGVTYTWYWAAGSLESADHCYAEVNTGSGWTTVDQLDNGEDDYTFRSGSWGGTGIDDTANFQIRFRVTTDSAD